MSVPFIFQYSTRRGTMVQHQRHAKLSCLILLLLPVVWSPTALVRADCDETATKTTTSEAQLARWPKLVGLDGPENVWQVSPRVYSGSEPTNFEHLQSIVMLGVETIVSVDGKQPNTDAAERHGLRYIHIPIGYDGIDRHSIASLMQVSRTIKGKIYVHCHHGKHRGPAAAAILTQIDDARSPTQSLQVLRACGTSKSYQGLWQSVRRPELPSDNERLPKLVSHAKTTDTVQSMVQIDQAYRSLIQQVEAAGQPNWRAIEREAILLSELFRELPRRSDERFRAKMGRSLNEQSRQFLGLAEIAQRRDQAEVGPVLQRIEAACAKCHTEMR